MSTNDLFNGDVFFEIIYPEQLEFSYRVRPAKDFGTPFKSFRATRRKLVPTFPTNGCKLIKNVKHVKGNIALIERGYVFISCVNLKKILKYISTVFAENVHF